MAAPFVHLEVLGPRASLDRWLAVLQDHGACHVADALTGLEGEAGVARPQATPAEARGGVLRSEAAHLLHGIERFLPPSSAEEALADRPAWSIGPGGEDEVDVEALRDEARVVGGRIREGLEAARSAEHAVEACDEEAVALDALSAAGAERVEGRLYLLSRARARRLQRALRAQGARAGAADTSRREAIVAAVGETAPGGVDAVLDVMRARPFALADELQGLGLREARTALDARREPARRSLEAALTALRRRLAGDGGRARALLDALEDAETRGRSWSRLASTRHVVAARVFVPSEDVDDLVRRLGHAFGPGEVVLRELDPAPPDMPALPRAVAGLPFAALEGLRPSRFGEVATASLLALFFPLAAATVLCDLAGGLVLLLVGALIGTGAVLGSPRRDTALLAQAAGLVALVFGILDGRAFGAAGVGWFGSDWGLLSSASLASADPVRTLTVRIGVVALALGLWGVVCALIALQRARPVRARTALVGALALFTVAGAVGLMFPRGSALRWIWLLTPTSAVGVLLLAGLRQGVGRLLLDLVGVLRCLAVALIALLLFTTGFALLERTLAPVTILSPALLALGALAMVVDPAYVAMGVPYDLSLGARALGRPFSPLTRHVVRGRAPSGEEPA